MIPLCINLSTPLGILLPVGGIPFLTSSKVNTMIILEGNITNKVITGANGDFSVGNFNTEVGQFKIKSQLLDQFEEGDYQVQVSVVKLSLNTYVVKRSGITITEIVADIDAINVIDADIKSVTVESIEPDASVDEIKADKARVTTEKKAVVKTDHQKPKKANKSETVLNTQKTKIPVTPGMEGDDEKQLPELFGHLWPLTENVKLDTTLPRTLIIKQKDYLYNQGYTFDLKTQIWSKYHG